MSASFSIVIEGKGTFTASIADPEASVTVGTNTPASFTAEVAPVGPAGATGATGPAGVVTATAPITYNSGTQTVAMDTAYFVRSPATAATDGQIISYDEATTRPVWIDNDARTLFVTVRNNTGTTIAAGKVVYISGATGNRPTIALAQANSGGNPDKVIGVTDESIANNSNGRVVVEGIVNDLDTSAFSAGDILWLSPTVAGGLQTARPVQPDHSVEIGIVTRSNPSLGSIEIRVSRGNHLEWLHDVLLTSKANNDLLVYESSSSLWKNKSFATLGLLTAPYNPFNQTLNTTDTVQFAGVSYYTATTPSNQYSVTPNSIWAGIYDGSNITRTIISSSGVTFPDATVQTTAAPSIAGLATLASPTFTGDPKAPTPTAGDNDTSIATTAFVNTYCPSASTTVEGKVELATKVESNAKSSSTLAVTPASLADYLVAPQVCIPDISGSTAVTSVGTTTVGSAGVRLALATAGSASGQYAARYFGASSNATVPHFLMRGEVNSTLDKRILLSARVRLNVVSNATHRFIFGKPSPPLTGGAVGDLSVKGFGLRVIGTGAVELQVHNGTTLTNVTSSFTPSNQISFDAVLENVGDGNVNLYIDDSLVATSSAGGTGDYTTSTIPVIWMETELTGAIATVAQLITNNVFLATVS